MVDNADLNFLKQRLASLGVNLPPAPSTSGATRPTGTDVAQLYASLATNIERGKKDVVDLLDRCNRVEDALHDAAEEAEWSQRQRSLPLSSPQRSAPSSRAASPVKVPALRFNTTASQTHSTKPTRSTQIPPPPSATMMRPSSAYSPRHNTADMDAQHTPLAYMIAQYKEAEAAWNNEKARLRREAAAERKRANKYELDFKKLSALHDHKVMDIKALKAALKNRDTQLGAAQERIKELESMLTNFEDETASRIHLLASERDELKALLQATLQRLDAVEEVVARADDAQAAMENKVVMLEEERLKAVEAAARARAEVAELVESRKRLQWQSKLLEKMSEVQLKHNKRKSDAIKKLLGGEADGVSAVTGFGDEDGETSYMPGSTTAFTGGSP